MSENTTTTEEKLLAAYDEAVAKYNAACDEAQPETVSDEDHDAYLDTIWKLVPDLAAVVRDVVAKQNPLPAETAG